LLCALSFVIIIIIIIIIITTIIIIIIIMLHHHHHPLQLSLESVNASGGVRKSAMGIPGNLYAQPPFPH